MKPKSKIFIVGPSAEYYMGDEAPLYWIVCKTNSIYGPLNAYINDNYKEISPYFFSEIKAVEYAKRKGFKNVQVI